VALPQRRLQKWTEQEDVLLVRLFKKGNISTSLAIVKEGTSSASAEVRGYLTAGSLQLPPNYSVENALKIAALTCGSYVRLKAITHKIHNPAIHN